MESEGLQDLVLSPWMRLSCFQALWKANMPWTVNVVLCCAKLEDF